MKKYLNIFAASFLALSIVISTSVLVSIFKTHKEEYTYSEVLGEQASTANSDSVNLQATEFPENIDIESSSQPIVSSISYGNKEILNSNKLFSSVFEWINEGYKLTAIPELYFDEDSQFLKDLSVSGSVSIENDLEIGGGLWVEEDATFEEDVTVDGDKIEINGVKYFWPDEQTSGTLINNGSGELSWGSTSSGPSTFLDLTDTPATYAGSATYLARVNAAGTAIEFIDPSTVGGVSSVSNSDGTLIISPTSGAVIASINLGNENTWTAAQTFNANTYFPSGIWDASGNVGIGATNANDSLDVAGNIDATGSYEIGNRRVLATPAGVTTTVIGIDAAPLLSSGSFDNTIVGYSAGKSISAGEVVNSVLMGSWAGADITTGDFNTLIGTNAGLGLTTGFDNVAMGDEITLSSGAAGNVLMGHSVGGSGIGDYNLAFGAYSNISSSSDYSIALGYDVDMAFSSSIGLGANADATAANQLIIGGNDANGFINDAYFGRGVTSATPSDITFNATGGSGSNIAGANLILAGGKATGNADSGDVIFSTANVLSSGSTLQSLTEKMRLTDEGRLGIGTTAPAYLLDVAGTASVKGLLTRSVLLSDLSTSLLLARFGLDGYTLFSGGIGTGGKDSLLTAQRITSSGNIVNVGSYQGGEAHLTKAGTYAAKVDYATGANPRSVTSADVNGDGSADLIVGNYGGGTISVLMSDGDGTFATKVDYPLNNFLSVGIAAGDINGDGAPDIAVGNESSAVVEVLLNDGDGTFGSSTSYATGSSPRNVAIGDVSGDGKADLVVSNYSSSTISVFINNGTGTFASKVDYASAGTNPSDLAIGDVSGDGKADIAVANFNGLNVSVFINNGNGTFATKVDYTTDANPYSVRLADVNADSKVDMVAASYSGSSVNVLINNGDGTFAAKVAYTVGGAPHNLDLADVSGDGKADVISINYSNASVLINNGNGTFATKVDYPTGDAALDIAVEDFNRDGKIDFATANNNDNASSVFINTPQTMLFAQASTGSVGIGTTAPTSGVALDINGTVRIAGGAPGANKVLISSANGVGSWADLSSIGVSSITGTANQITASASTGAVTLSLPSTLIAPGTLQSLGNITFGDNISDTVTSNAGSWTFANATAVDLAASTTALNIELGLLNLDTTNSRIGIGTTAPSYKLDVAGTSRVWNLITQNILLSGLSTSNISAVFGHEGYTSFTGGIGTGGKDSILGAQRLTSSGDLVNISTIQAGESHFTNAGTLAAKVDYTAGSAPEGVAIGDVNGDRWNDLVTANYSSNTISVFINDGDGTYATKVDYAAGSLTQSVAMGDLNGDGMADLVAANSNSNTVSVFINNGNGTFAAKVDYAAGSLAYTPLIGDLNGDGKADLAVSNENGNSISVLINNGNGTFAAKVDYTTGTGPRGAALGDLNGDGKVDLVTANNSAGSVSVLTNNGNGTFATKVDYSLGTGAMSVAVGDLNGDGKDDVVAAIWLSNTASVLINNGDGTLATDVDYGTGSQPVAVAIGDITGDGKAEIVTANSNADTISVLRNNGNGTFATKVDYAGGDGPYSVAIGDLNSDGKADVVETNYLTTTMSVLMNQPQTILYAQASTGNVGIGTTAPTSKLAIANLGTGTGTTLVIDATGNVYRDSSSERYKMDIEPLEADYSKILELEPKSYKFKESGILSIGYIAEEVEALGGLSDLLIYDTNGEVDGFKYDRLPIYTLEIVKDLDERVRAIEDHLGIIESRVAGVSSEDGSSDANAESDYSGIIVVDEDGDVTIENSTRIKGILRAAKVNIDTKSEAIGKVIIPSGETIAAVGSATLTGDSLIFITADEPVVVSAKKTDYDHFEIELSEPQGFDVTVNWVIIN